MWNKQRVQLVSFATNGKRTIQQNFRRCRYISKRKRKGEHKIQFAGRTVWDSVYVFLLFLCFCLPFPSLYASKKMCVLCVDFSQAFTLFRIVHICSSQIDISAHSHTHKIIIIIILSSAETHPLPQSHTLKHTLIIVYMSRVTCVIQQKTKATITFLTTMYQ